MTEVLIRRLREKRMRVHDLSGVGFEKDPVCEEAAARLEAQARLIETLTAALEPFEKVGRLIDGPFGPALFANDDDAFQSGCAWTEDGERKTLTWGDFRRARTALAQARKPR